VPVTFRNVAGFLATLIGTYLLCEFAVFRSGWYARYLEPAYSGAGELERMFCDEALRPPSGKKEVLVIGNSRIAEGFSAKVATEYKPEDGYRFLNFSVPGTGDRVWYYLVRDVDPQRNRYVAIAIPIDDYDDFDDYEDVSDRVSEMKLLINRIRLADIPTYVMSFKTWKYRYEIFRRVTLKGLEYQRDFQDFLEHPKRRLERVEDYRVHNQSWGEGYNGIHKSLAGMQIDWANERITFPPGMPEETQHFLTGVFFSHPPQLGRNRDFETRWLGALVDLYRGTKTKIIIFQAPRSAGPRPKPDKKFPWTSTDDLRKRPWVRVVDRHAFESLERPEYFADHVHLNSTGRKLFSPMLADAVKENLR
jgi:hypothetical protein